MRTLRIHYLQHVDFEGLGFIETWANQSNYPISSSKLYENSNFPDLNDFD